MDQRKSYRASTETSGRGWRNNANSTSAAISLKCIARGERLSRRPWITSLIFSSTASVDEMAKDRANEESKR